MSKYRWPQFGFYVGIFIMLTPLVLYVEPNATVKVFGFGCGYLAAWLQRSWLE